MMSFIRKHKILYCLQFGFRDGHSTAHTLINLVDKIKWALDNGQLAVAIFLDIQKAFDCINHDILLSKLDHYGFRGLSLQLLRSYLSDRKQFLSLNGNNSSEKPINMGVPQGSILGPLLFLLYVNDLNNSTRHIEPAMFTDNHSECTLFADDTAALLCDADHHNLLYRTKNTLRELSKWYIANKLSLSIGKSNYIVFHNKGSKVAKLFPETIKIGAETINRVNVTKYIGVLIDQHLNWGEHIAKTCKSLLKLFGIYYRLRKFVTPQLSRTIYYASIYSKISYGIEVYGTASDK